MKVGSVVSDVQSIVADTYTVVPNVHQDILKIRGDNGQSRAVSDATASPASANE